MIIVRRGGRIFLIGRSMSEIELSGDLILSSYSDIRKEARRLILTHNQQSSLFIQLAKRLENIPWTESEGNNVALFALDHWTVRKGMAGLHFKMFSYICKTKKMPNIGSWHCAGKKFGKQSLTLQLVDFVNNNMKYYDKGVNLNEQLPINMREL